MINKKLVFGIGMGLLVLIVMGVASASWLTGKATDSTTIMTIQEKKDKPFTLAGESHTAKIVYISSNSVIVSIDGIETDKLTKNSKQTIGNFEVLISDIRYYSGSSWFRKSNVKVEVKLVGGETPSSTTEVTYQGVLDMLSNARPTSVYSLIDNGKILYTDNDTISGNSICIKEYGVNSICVSGLMYTKLKDSSNYFGTDYQFVSCGNTFWGPDPETFELGLVQYSCTSP